MCHMWIYVTLIGTVRKYETGLSSEASWPGIFFGTCLITLSLSYSNSHFFFFLRKNFVFVRKITTFFLGFNFIAPELWMLFTYYSYIFVPVYILPEFRVFLLHFFFLMRSLERLSILMVFPSNQFSDLFVFSTIFSYFS